MRSSCQAVLFDSANTLVHVYPSVGAVYGETAADFGVEIPVDVVDAAFEQAWRELRGASQVDMLESSEAKELAFWRQIVRRVFEITSPATHFDGRFNAFFDCLFQRFAEADAWRIFDDVLPALEHLRSAGYRLGVASNFDSRLYRLFDALELTPWFDTIWTSAQTGWRKPHPCMLELAANALSDEPAEVLYVGDSPHEDVVAAQQAGLRPVLLDRAGVHASADVPTIGALTELPGILGRLG